MACTGRDCGREGRTALVYCASQFSWGIRIVQDHHGTANATTTKKDFEVLVTVARRDAYAVTWTQPHVEHRLGEHPASLGQLAVAEPDGLPRHNHRLFGTVMRFLQVDELAQCLVPERRLGRAKDYSGSGSHHWGRL